MSKHLQVIVGLGASGFSSAHYLYQKGMPIALMDTRENPPNLAAIQTHFPGVPLKLGGLDQALLDAAERIILSPGIASKEPLIAAQIAKGKSVVGDIELFAEAVKAPVIAITGTNAKSTVTTLVGEMALAAGFKAQVGGNLGIPALDLLAKNPEANLFVLELSSFQLETTYSLRPQTACILNITPDHMDRYATLAEYQQAKYRVYQHCSTAVCNRDDALTDCHVPVRQKTYFTERTPQENEFGLLTYQNETYLAFGKQRLLACKEIPVPGKHYQLNALAALAIGFNAGFALEKMLPVLKTFPGLPHRCQFICEHQAVRWYNDSKGTNVGATLAAIQGLGPEISGKLILIAGGVGKNADFSPLLPAIQKYSRHVVLIGEAAAEIAAVIAKTVPYSIAHSMAEAVKQAQQAAQPQDCVLLSPACASFDMFQNYAHRGEVFTETVNNHIARQVTFID